MRSFSIILAAKKVAADFAVFLVEFYSKALQYNT